MSRRTFTGSSWGLLQLFRTRESTLYLKCSSPCWHRGVSNFQVKRTNAVRSTTRLCSACLLASTCSKHHKKAFATNASGLKSLPCFEGRDKNTTSTSKCHRLLCLIEESTNLNSFSTCAKRNGEKKGDISDTETKHFAETSGELDKSLQKDEHLKDLLKEIHLDFGKHAEDQDGGDSSSSDSSSSSSDSESESDVKSNRGKPVSDNKATPAAKKIDVDLELLRYDYEEFEEKEDYDLEDEEEEEVHTISLERGSTGVFDLEEAVQLLKEDNAMDVCVIRVPAEIKYADHMIIVTGRSLRHLRAMAEYLKRMFKLKRRKGDPPTVRIEGKNTEWLVLDIGNIVVHLFTESVRAQYDLETLWTVGPDYDDQSQTHAGGDHMPFFWNEADFEQFNADVARNRGAINMESKYPSDSLQESSDNWHKKV